MTQVKNAISLCALAAIWQRDLDNIIVINHYSYNIQYIENYVSGTISSKLALARCRGETSLGNRQPPAGCRLVGASTDERQLMRMPATLNDLVSMFGDHHGGEWAKEVTTEVGEDDPLIVGGGEEVVGIGWETNWAHFVAVCRECLQRAVATDVPQHARAILVPRRQDTSGWVHRHGSKRTTCTRAM